jgi:hypothetical protein
MSIFVDGLINADDILELEFLASKLYDLQCSLAHVLKCTRSPPCMTSSDLLATVLLWIVFGLIYSVCCVKET